MGAPKIRAIVVALVVVIAMLLVIGIPRVRRHEEELEGLWVGEPAFVKQAGLSELYVLFDKHDRQTVPGYLVMLDSEGNEVFDGNFEIEYASPAGRLAGAIAGHLSNAPLASDVHLFGDEADGPPPPWPERFTVDHDERKGTLTFRSDEKLLAVFVQDREASNQS